MNEPRTNTDRPTRRSVLRAGLAWAVLPCLPAAARRIETGRTLVLLHLSGGNDSLNTLIPYADPLYYELRPRLSRAARNTIAVGRNVGLHASLAALAPMFHRGHLALIRGVGSPCPDYSHVGSCRIWFTGGVDAVSPRGWWDGIAERIPGRSDARAVCVGETSPVEMATAGLAPVCRPGGPAGTVPAATNPLPYRPGDFRRTLGMLAEVAASAHAPALTFASVGGFDTHEDQLPQHAEVLRELGDGLAAFQQEIEQRGAAERVLLAAWSEFGRRPAENAAGGTDHGAAGLVLLVGRHVRGGVYGRAPSLLETDFGNLVPTVDFRSVHALLAERWLGVPAGKVPLS